MGIEHVSPDTDINKILEIIERDAAVVIDNVLSSKDLDEIKNGFINELSRICPDIDINLV